MWPRRPRGGPGRSRAGRPASRALRGVSGTATAWMTSSAGSRRSGGGARRGIVAWRGWGGGAPVQPLGTPRVACGPWQRWHARAGEPSGPTVLAPNAPPLITGGNAAGSRRRCPRGAPTVSATTVFAPEPVFLSSLLDDRDPRTPVPHDHPVSRVGLPKPGIRETGAGCARQHGAGPSRGDGRPSGTTADGSGACVVLRPGAPSA
jgi:hypothetical protein